MSVEKEGGAPGPGGVVFRRPAAGDRRSARPVLGATTTPWVLDLIARFRGATDAMLVCPHLAEDPGEGAVWLAAVPDLRSCRRAACTEAVAATLEERLGRPGRDEPTRCTTCGRVDVPVRGVGVAVGHTMLRGTVCEDCLAAKPVPTPPAAVEPEEAVARRAATIGDEPIAVRRGSSAAAEEHRPSPEDQGWRALRRGCLMAEACCRSTAAPLDPDRAVIGGLLVRAAKLARGLIDAPRGDGSLLQEEAFRSLVRTTTTLWWLVREGSDDDLAAFRDASSRAWGADDLGDRLEALGRADDLAVLLGPDPDVAPGSWRELIAGHLSPAPDGFGLHLAHRPVTPMAALVAGEHLSLASADVAARMPTDLDPDDLRRLAEEVSELRAVVARSADDLR
ncbi:hypothetical protein [Patulibacter minatonensis]|uniref:hypothetical protein n=1 Tax=Patulibacter minatonensis TaxID=298163 RepID=UPI00047CB7BF|nr:hypothetical protein [Patulibacter minatonensis]